MPFYVGLSQPLGVESQPDKVVKKWFVFFAHEFLPEECALALDLIQILCHFWLPFLTVHLGIKLWQPALGNNIGITRVAFKE